jgi:murein endopeptidase
MSWRRGELWLETDVLWFREGADAPAVASFAPTPLPALQPSSGLVASRQRRSASKRRRNLRRVSATALALVLALASILAFAVLRSRDHGTSVIAERPPTVAVPARPEKVEAGERPLLREGAHNGVSHAIERPRASSPTRQRSAAHAHAASKIQWHHATSVGLPYHGRLIDGTQLPVEGPSWVTWNPLTDSVPNAPRRLYGNERTIRAVIAVTRAYRAAHPRAARVVVGDISRDGGGPMVDEHVSHQNGLDVDIYLPRRDRTPRAATTSRQIAHRLAQDLVDRFVAAGARMIFVGYATSLHGPAGVVIPYPGHEYHMHVRFPPPRR